MKMFVFALISLFLVSGCVQGNDQQTTPVISKASLVYDSKTSFNSTEEVAGYFRSNIELIEEKTKETNKRLYAPYKDVEAYSWNITSFDSYKLSAANIEANYRSFGDGRGIFTCWPWQSHSLETKLFEIKTELINPESQHSRSTQYFFSNDGKIYWCSTRFG